MTTGATIIPIAFGNRSEVSSAIWSNFMNFSIKATIRAFVAPEHRLTCASSAWRQIVAELERRGQGQHESGVFLLGVHHGERREVQAAVYYDELDPNAYASGVCILHGDAFAKLWSICRARNLTVVADAHTHPDEAFQSFSDRTNPMVARLGHIAIVIPNFARWPIQADQLGVYEYRGDHEWTDRNARKAPGYFYTGFWS
jgi:hypothetical protein